jgi:hypothetical protein
MFTLMHPDTHRNEESRHEATSCSKVRNQMGGVKKKKEKGKNALNQHAYLDISRK